MRAWVAALLLTALGLARHVDAFGLTRPEKELATRRLLKQLADLGLWSGVVACSDGAADSVYEDAYGTASYELNRAPMSPGLKMPVAQNTHLLLAIAAHQLQNRGLLNLTDPADRYLQPGALGLAGRWCPRVRGAPADAPCEQPTLHQLLTHTSGLWDSQACTNPEDWQAPHCASAAAATAGNFTPPVPGAAPAAWALANWTLGQPLGAEPGSAYAFSDDGYRLLGVIIEQVSGRSLADYLAANVLGPAGLNATLYRSGASTGLAEGLVDNAGYLALFNATAGQATPLYVPLSLNASVAPNNEGGLYTDRFAELERAAGSAFSTARDLHTLYRVLFASPQLLGLTPGDVDELAAPEPAASLGGPVYGAEGLLVNTNDSSYYGAGTARSWHAYPSIRLPPSGDAAAAPVCAAISNLSPQIVFADTISSALFEQQCKAVKSTAQMVREIAAAEPKAVANMTADERQVALLSHLCYMTFYENVGLTAEEYVRDAVAAYLWGARASELEAQGLIDVRQEEAAAAAAPAAATPATPGVPASPATTMPSPTPSPSPSPPATEEESTGGGNGAPTELEVKGVGAYTDWVLECKLGRARCINLSLASMGYQCMNLQGTACCATERGRVCQPTYKEGAGKFPKGWKGKVPAGATYKEGRGGGGGGGNGNGDDDAGGAFTFEEDQ